MSKHDADPAPESSRKVGPPAFGRHARVGRGPDVLKHRLVVAFVALGTVGGFVLAYLDRGNRDSVLVWAGLSVFAGAVTVVVASLGIGPRPLRSFGAGAWFTGSAVGAFMVWAGRKSPVLVGPRWVLMPPLMLMLGFMLATLGLWLMIRRPEQNWERELRDAHVKHQAPDVAGAPMEKPKQTGGLHEVDPTDQGTPTHRQDRETR